MIRAALLFLLCMSAALASPLPLPTQIPSAASGRYATPNGDCSVVFARFGPDHVNVDCPGELDVTPAGVRCFGTCSHSTVFAFRGACPGSPGVANVFPVEGSNPNSQWLAFDAVDGANLIVRRGVTAAQLYNGGGVAERWTRNGWIDSPSPYTCPLPAQPRHGGVVTSKVVLAQPLRFRVFGR